MSLPCNQPKRQLLNDYLIQTGLVEASQLDIWESERQVFWLNDQTKEVRFTLNLLIKKLTPKHSIDDIEHAVLWWLSVYEANFNKEKPRFIGDSSLIDSRVTEYFLAIPLTEKSKLVDGQTKLCVKPLGIPGGCMTDLPIWLRLWIDDAAYDQEVRLK